VCIYMCVCVCGCSCMCGCVCPFGLRKTNRFKQNYLLFYVLLTVHLSIITVINQLNGKFLYYNKFIICLYMFRALLCSSSGGQNCIIWYLVSSHSVRCRPVHRLREDSVLSQPVHRTANYRVYQMLYNTILTSR